MARIARARIVLLLAAAAGLGSAVAGAHEDIERRIAACAGCHGEQGRSTGEVYAPSIAGKPSGYLYQQLLSFRDGRRQHLVMRHMLSYLSDAYLDEIASYYAGQTPATAARARAANPESLAVGRRIVSEGDPSRGLPACQSCHGDGLLGAEPAIPGLLALSSDYLTAQLGAWRAGTRRALAPDCMAVIAQKLTLEELAAVTAWIASVPVPEDHSPSARAPSPLPLPCGSVP